MLEMEEVEDSRWNRLLFSSSPEGSLPWESEDVELVYPTGEDNAITDMRLYDYKSAEKGGSNFRYTFFFSESGYAFRFGKTTVDNLEDGVEALESDDNNIIKQLDYNRSIRRMMDRLDEFEYDEQEYLQEFKNLVDTLSS